MPTNSNSYIVPYILYMVISNEMDIVVLSPIAGVNMYIATIDICVYIVTIAIGIG